MMDITNGVIFDRTVKEGFKFNGFNTAENDMYLVNRSAPTPTEKEIIENLPFVQGSYDFSNILGDRFFNNRLLSYEFHVHERDYDRRKHEQTVFENKLMGTHIKMLEDTHDPSYYYLGKCVSVDTEDDHVYGRLIVNIDFDCYPFKINKLPEGHDIWDEFNFELDVAQPTDFHIKRPDQDGSSFKPLQVGDEATIGAWATQYGEHEGERNPIFQSELGVTSIITGITSNDTSISNRAYYLEGFEAPIVEQDILQAYTTGLDITLINPGTTSVAPKVTVDGKVSLVKNNTVYNFYGGTFENTLFRLEPGENHIKVFSILERDISFDFRKELI